jgi:hypothetical protein
MKDWMRILGAEMSRRVKKLERAIFAEFTD